MLVLKPGLHSVHCTGSAKNLIDEFRKIARGDPRSAGDACSHSDRIGHPVVTTLFYSLLSVQVLMDQMWCCFHMNAKHPRMEGMQSPSQLTSAYYRGLLRILYESGVDWTDPSAWPEDYVDGHWKRQIPIPFLMGNIRTGSKSSISITIAICEGEHAYIAYSCSGSAHFVACSQPGPPALVESF